MFGKWLDIILPIVGGWFARVESTVVGSVTDWTATRCLRF